MSARYTHKYAFRGLIPMTTASSVLGKEKTDTRHMYLGPNGHALTFPVAGGKLLNVVAFVTDPDEWPHANSFTAPAKKADAIEAFKEFGPTVRSIIDMLPDELSKWAVFDTYDNPAPTFVKGRVCITGDAAHAAAPYHGAGAGFAIEDGAVLADVDTSKKAYLVEKALQTYDNIRLERAQWLVETSRYIGEMYEWQNTRVGSDHMLSAKEIDWRCRRIWDYDVDGMMRQTRELFDRHLSAVPA
jgi:salicylate hydroxylase